MKNIKIAKYSNVFLISLIIPIFSGCINSGSGAPASNSSVSSISKKLSTQSTNGNGEYIYVLDANRGGFHFFTVNKTVGTMDYYGFIGQEGGARHLAVSPDKRFLYVTSPGTRNVFSYSIDQSTGIPTRQQAIQLNGNDYDLDRLFLAILMVKSMDILIQQVVPEYEII